MNLRQRFGQSALVEVDFPALFEDYYDQIATYLMRRQVDRCTAEDMAQTTFLEAYDREQP